MAKRKLQGGSQERVWTIYYAAFLAAKLFPSALIRGQAAGSVGYATTEDFLVKKSIQHDTSG